MANRLKHIKKVRSNDEVNNLQLLFEFVLGESLPGKYDPTKTYNPRDFIIHFNKDESKYEILMCTGTTTGPFDETKWDKVTITDYMSQGNISVGKNEDIIQIKEEKPTETHNRVWLKPMAYKDLNTEILENGNMTVIFNGDEFRGQDDMPEEENVKLWFDYEYDFKFD